MGRRSITPTGSAPSSVRSTSTPDASDMGPPGTLAPRAPSPLARVGSDVTRVTLSPATGACLRTELGAPVWPDESTCQSRKYMRE
ncbi:hypothetical protein CCE01nite_33710 [Cellulomonas cellasea]|uniref:Uncharacterized protein n=1 Tax=Cellulomonas cellasea TaxID=43670 RepID=A0A4Y3KZ53_9CELL|nr:hypothetical protein CCE01nite_33710 [Cellulomonas cellasea]